MEPNSETLAGRDGVSVHAGFPNPAADRRDTPLSLDRLLITHPSSTYIFRIRGHHWQRYGIFDGDIALIDRSLSPLDRDLVVWWQESGEFCLSRLSQIEQQTIWGVISAIVHPVRKVQLYDE